MSQFLAMPEAPLQRAAHLITFLSKSHWFLYKNVSSAKINDTSLWRCSTSALVKYYWSPVQEDFYFKRIKYAKQNKTNCEDSLWIHAYRCVSHPARSRIIRKMRAITIICTWHVPIEQVVVRDRQQGEFSSFVHDCVRSLAIVARWLYGSACSEANFKADERGISEYFNMNIIFVFFFFLIRPNWSLRISWNY